MKNNYCSQKMKIMMNKVIKKYCKINEKKYKINDTNNENKYCIKNKEK
jgi:hypothetical protein